MAQRPPVVVAVVSWNTRERLAACLRSLAPDVEAGRAEVWVIDNASRDGSAAMVRSDFAWARLIESSQNLGFGAAVNRVAQEAGSRFLAAANADVELAPGALAALLDTAERHAGAGIVAPRLLLPDGSTQHSVHGFPTLRASLVLNLGLHRLVPALGDRLCLVGAWDPDRPREVDWAVGALLLVRREAWEAAGGFDPGQWMYAEDLDLGWRAARAGWSTRYEPAARVVHHESAATDQAWGAERIDRAQASTYAWMLRRRGVIATRACAIVSVVGATARLALFAPLARLRPGRFGRSRDESRAWMRRHRAGLARREHLPGGVE